MATPKVDETMDSKIKSKGHLKYFFKNLASKVDIDAPTILMMLKYAPQASTWQG